MRVTLLTPWFPNKRDGWPARFISDSAIALTQSGAKISMSVFRGWAPCGLEKFASREHWGQIYRADFPEFSHLQTNRYLTAPGELMRNFSNLTLDRAVSAALTKEIVAFRPDVVHVQTELLAPAAVKVAVKHNLPIIVTIHGENTSQSYLRRPQQAKRFKAALSNADKIVIVGEPLKGYAARLSGRQDHIVTVWNGVEPPANQRVVPTPDNLPIEFICVANQQEGKGIELLIDALARLKPRPGSCLTEWRLALIGDGPLRTELQHQVKSAGLSQHVTFAGTMSNTDVFEHLRHADIFVLPSYREAFGIAYVEAMASGLLTIGVEGQGPSQFIVNGRTGLLMKPRDVDSLETTLRTVLTDPKRKWRNIAQAGMIFARKSCTWPSHAEKLMKTYQLAATSRKIAHQRRT